MRERRRKWYKNNKDKHRDYMLSYVYGISLEEYNDMLDLQGGVCAICGNQEVILDKKGERIMLAVDHDHETGAVRGLLCSYCNTAIGGFFDDSTLLRKAADYLDSHKATPKDRGRTVTISIDSEDSDTHIQLVLDI